MGNGEIAQAGVTNRRDQAVTRRVDNLISGHVCSGLIVFLRLLQRFTRPLLNTGENVRITSPWAITSWGTTGWPESSTVRLLMPCPFLLFPLRLMQVADLSPIGFPSSSSRPFLCFVRLDHHTSAGKSGPEQTYCSTSNRVTVKPRA
jgi:hypothetical protein